MALVLLFLRSNANLHLGVRIADEHHIAIWLNLNGSLDRESVAAVISGSPEEAVITIKSHFFRRNLQLKLKEAGLQK